MCINLDVDFSKSSYLGEFILLIISIVYCLFGDGPFDINGLCTPLFSIKSFPNLLYFECKNSFSKSLLVGDVLNRSFNSYSLSLSGEMN
jgi:hypothetical protein